MVVMAEKRPLYAQLPDMPAGKVLEDVFAQAAGFSLADQNDEYFIPEMSRAEAVLFPNDSPMALGQMGGAGGLFRPAPIACSAVNILGSVEAFPDNGKPPRGLAGDGEGRVRGVCRVPGAGAADI